jgi:hypothetical protein
MSSSTAADRPAREPARSPLLLGAPGLLAPPADVIVIGVAGTAD